MIFSPVCGFLPSLADLSEILNTPNPDTETFSPFANSSLNKSKVALKTYSQSAFVNPVLFAKTSIISDFFILSYLLTYNLIISQ